jgi:hypothetical protein
MGKPQFVDISLFLAAAILAGTAFQFQGRSSAMLRLGILMVVLLGLTFAAVRLWPTH